MGEGKFIKSVGEEYQVGKVISWMWGRIISKKKERGSKIIFPIIFRLLGRISSGKSRRGHTFLRRKSRF